MIFFINYNKGDSYSLAEIVKKSNKMDIPVLQQNYEKILKLLKDIFLNNNVEDTLLSQTDIKEDLITPLTNVKENHITPLKKEKELPWKNIEG